MNSMSARPCRSFVFDLIARAEADPDSDEAHFLHQLRAAIAGLETQPRTSFPARPRSPRPDLRMVYSAE